MRRRTFALALPAVASLALAGCASGAPAAAPAATGSAGAGFPISITGALGTATIRSRPVRVATVAWTNQEVPLALGVVPVGMPKATFGDDNGNGVLPWVEDRLRELGAKTPTLFDETSGIDFESVAGTRPDVILAAYSGLTQDDYDKLSQIAPVVGYPDKPWTTSLDDTILLDSEGLGLRSRGQRLIRTLEAQIAAAVAKQPGVKGRTVAFVAPKGPTDFSSLSVYTTHDPRPEFLERIGMTTPAVVRRASAATATFFTDISAEDADRLDDVDVLVLYGDAAMLARMQADPLLGRIPAIERGSVAAIGSDGPLAASANPSPLSIGWGIGRYVDLLGAAAAKAG